MWRIGLAFLIGHCVVHLLAVLPPALYAWLLAAALMIAAWRRYVLLTALLLGIAWAWFNAGVRLSDDLPASLEGQDIVVRGFIASMPDTTDTDPQFEFDTVERAAGVPSRIRLAWYDTAQWPAAGERWQFVVRLKRRNGFANPGGFDYEGLLFRERIGATGYVRADARNLRLSRASWRYGILRLRAWLASRIALATHDHSQLGVLQGLAVGQTQAMTAEQWRVFAATGTTHLLAISGLHISMVAALLAWWGGRLVWLPGAQRRGWTAVRGKASMGVFGAVTYSCLAGLSVPTQRTLIMLCVFFAARWCRRELGVGNSLGLSLIAILLWDPFAPLAAGAWLSFVAVAVILLASGGQLGRAGVLRGFTHVQLAVTIGMAPLVIAAFSALSLISPLANAMAVPLFTLVLVPLVLIGTMLSAFSLSAGSALLGLATKLLAGCWPGIEWLASLPLAVWHVPSLPLPVFVALLVGAWLLVIPAIWPVRVAALLLCAPAMLHRPSAPLPGEFELTMLDVGQGLAVSVRTRSHTLVYDTGPAFRSGRDTGELVVLPFLHSIGVRYIDMLMVSHADLDHRGGLLTLLRSMPTRQLLLGPSLRPSEIATALNVGGCRAGERWQWDGVTFDVLHPGNASYRSDNDSSCVLRITGSGGSALLTGDVESLAESDIVNRGLPATDIVIVAHHGSRSSSTPALVAAAHAKYALFSAGYRNRWGFPKSDIVARWQQSGASGLSTIDSGAILMTVGARGVAPPTRYRDSHRHYWSGR